MHRTFDRAAWAIGALMLTSACGDDGDTSTATVGPQTSTQSVGSGGAGGTGGSGTGGAGGEPCRLSGSWTLVDDYNVAPTDGTSATSIAVDGQGVIYVYGDHANLSESLVRRSNDGGQSWETTSMFQCGVPRTMGVDAQGSLFVGCANGMPLHSLVLKSSNSGMSFETSDDYVLDPSMPCYSPNVVTGLDGAVYAGGLCSGDDKFVRKTTNGGQSWSSVAVFPVQGASALLFLDATADSTIYMGGPDGGGWRVRRIDGGSSTVVEDDTFALAPEKNSSVWGIRAIGPRVYAQGMADDENDVDHAILRRRDTAGTWSTVDDVSMATTGAPPIESAGTLVYLVNNQQSALTRVSSDDGASWQTVDTYAYASRGPTRANALATDQAGNLYSVYTGSDANGVNHWIVRKMSCE